MSIITVISLSSSDWSTMTITSHCHRFIATRTLRLTWLPVLETFEIIQNVDLLRWAHWKNVTKWNYQKTRAFSLRNRTYFFWCLQYRRMLCRILLPQVKFSLLLKKLTICMLYTDVYWYWHCHRHLHWHCCCSVLWVLFHYVSVYVLIGLSRNTTASFSDN